MTRPDLHERPWSVVDDMRDEHKSAAYHDPTRYRRISGQPIADSDVPDPSDLGDTE